MSITIAAACGYEDTVFLLSRADVITLENSTLGMVMYNAIAAVTALPKLHVQCVRSLDVYSQFVQATLSLVSHDQGDSVLLQVSLQLVYFSLTHENMARYNTHKTGYIMLK